MNRVIKGLRTSFICLLAMITVAMLTFKVVASATELEGSVAAIIVVEGYTVEGGPLKAGKDVTINLTLHNASRNASASSILMTVSSNSGLIYPSFGNDNQFYIGTISAGASETVSIPITISNNYFGDSVVDLSCAFSYVTLNTAVSNTATIVIPNSGGGSVEVKSANVSSHATVNGESLLSVSYVNLTNEKISNAEILVDGNVSADSKAIDLGAIGAGKSYSEDCRIKFTEAGDQEIKIVFAYTDVDGTRVETDLGKYSVEVVENQQVTEEEENSEIMLWLGRGISAVGIILIIVAVILYIRKR